MVCKSTLEVLAYHFTSLVGANTVISNPNTAGNIIPFRLAPDRLLSWLGSDYYMWYNVLAGYSAVLHQPTIVIVS